jgi:hypothetical protein
MITPPPNSAPSSFFIFPPSCKTISALQSYGFDCDFHLLFNKLLAIGTDLV